MQALRVCMATQSPPVRFLADAQDLEAGGEPVDCSLLKEGTDFVPSTGGVPIMLRDVARRQLALGRWREPVWVALNPAGPERYALDGIRVRSVDLDPATARLYALGKEKLWNAVHALGRDGLAPEEFRAYAAFNWRTAAQVLEALPESDVAYVHDFQLLQVGALLGLGAPAVFRWHIPFRPRTLSPYLRRFVVRSLEAYDAVVVSTRRDLEGLVDAGYRGRAHQVYPVVRRGAHERRVPASEVQAFEDRWGLAPSQPMVLCVGRMDPIKGQDRVLRALPRVLRKVPDARAVMVGNGSFTSSAAHGLGHPKGRRWRARLEGLARELGVEKATTFTGYMAPQELRAGWERASVVVVPSTLEGFGTTAVEGWFHGKPVVLSRGAGASELVVEGVNGLTYEPDDVDALAHHLLQVLGSPALAERLGERGRELARTCDLDRGAEAEDALLRETIQRFHEAHRA